MGCDFNYDVSMTLSQYQYVWKYVIRNSLEILQNGQNINAKQKKNDIFNCPAPTITAKNIKGSKNYFSLSKIEIPPPIFRIHYNSIFSLRSIFSTKILESRIFSNIYLSHLLHLKMRRIIEKWCKGNMVISMTLQYINK